MRITDIWDSFGAVICRTRICQLGLLVGDIGADPQTYSGATTRAFVVVEERDKRLVL